MVAIERFLGLAVGVGIVIFLHELGHFTVAKWRGIRVDIFSLGFGPRLAGLKRGDTEYRLSWLPLGGYVKMAGEHPEEALQGDPREFLSQPRWSRFLVVLAGPVMNLILGFLIFMGVFLSGMPEPVIKEAILEHVSPGSPADQAGLRPGDLIVSVNGRDIQAWEILTEEIRRHPGIALTLGVSRGGDRLLIPATPRAMGEGEHRIGQLGVQPKISSYTIRRLTLGEAAQGSWRMTVASIEGFFITIRRLFAREVNVGDSLRGPIGIIDMAVEQMKVGVANFIWLLGQISVSLAVVNLLPIPVLDGGHIMVLAVEGIRRKSLPVKVQIVIQQIGLVLLLTLVLFTSFHDIMRWWAG